MSEAARRNTRNKAYVQGYAAGAEGGVVLNPYKSGSQSGADRMFVEGLADGKCGAVSRFGFEKDSGAASVPAAESKASE